MRTFSCACGARVFFENSQCLNCQRELGFLPESLTLTALEGGGGEFVTSHGRYRKCANYVDEGVCNWMVPADGGDALCRACQLNNVIPDLSLPENRRLWAAVENAKRHLVYSLSRLGLPLLSKRQDPERGLSFDIKADSGDVRVLTGHSDGLITLNLAEADPARREQARMEMNERYRTLLGHFRHEIGHYYWDRLVRDTNMLEPFRALFGDETEDYAAALERHYSAGPGGNYADCFISAYAAAHPWEDFAETFAHYLHLEDTLETAQQFRFVSRPLAKKNIYEISDFDALMGEWMGLSVALNALNRSMGLPDAYPFAISARVSAKLQFVHRLVRANQRTRRGVPRAAAREARLPEQ